MYFILSPQLKKDILITQNPYNENIDVSELEMKILIDRQDEINIKPQIVRELEQREGLIEIGRGINNFSNRGIGSSNKIQEIGDGSVDSMEVDRSESSLTKKSLLSVDEIQKASESELNYLIKQIKKELKIRKERAIASSSFREDTSVLESKIQQSQQRLDYLTDSKLNNSHPNNLPTNWIVGGAVLVAVGLVSFLVIKNTKKKLK